MRSLADSVHRLLCDQIAALSLESHYTIQKSSIVGRNGTEFIFAGLAHNVASIKSLEAVDRVFVEEAQTVSQDSWTTLIPTIRKEGSEIVVTFNPDFEDDAVYQMFVVNPPPNAVVVKIGYRDNPWFPQVLREEMEHLRATNPDEFNHVYEGTCISLLASAIYANELRAVDREGRIRNVPYDPSRPVDCFWDLGYGDQTAVWFAQSFPFEYRLIDYIEAAGKNIQWYLQQMQSRGYVYGTDWLPWDLGLHAAAMGSGKSIEELMRLAGRKVRIVPKLSVADGINAARTILPLCWFDSTRCAEGIRALRHYRYGEIKTLGHVTREPLHDMACFSQYTPVLTRYGTSRIMDLPQGGEVLTPCGWRTYVGPKITRRNAQLVEVRFADGYTVKCTPDHLFLTENGWRSAESLTPNTLIRSSLTHSHSILMEASIGFGRMKDTFLGVAKSCIEMFGRALSELFPMIATSTIGMQMEPITNWTIWSVFRRPIISPSHGMHSLAKTNISTWKPEIRPRSGTNRLLAASGINATPSVLKAGRSGNAKKNHVRIAARFLTRWFATEGPEYRSTAVQNARPPLGEDGRANENLVHEAHISRTAVSEPQRIANTAASSIVLWFARLLHRTRTDSVPRYAESLRVRSVKALAEREDVCCIYVEDGHWFSLANGAVVHNSHGADSFRYFSLIAKPPKPAQSATARPHGRELVGTWT